MFLRELKVNLKSFLLWLMSLIVLCFLVFLLYQSVMKGANLESINEVLRSFPEDVLKMFNLDISGIDSAFGWLKTEGLTFIYIITGIYSAILGSGILTKEEDEKTIEYLNSLPVSRNYIISTKFLVGLIYIVSMVVGLTLFNFVCLLLSGDFDIKIFFMISLTPFLPALIIYSFCMFLSTFFHKTKGIMSISMAIAFFSYFMLAVSEMSEKVEYFKYFSVFTLADSRNIIVNSKYNLWCLLVFVVLFTASTLLVYCRYNKKELV